jgi:starch-binding outer membrane protein, SusD/RagB family
MKKYGFLPILILIVIGMISACSEEILDKKPLDKFSELDVWNDVNLTDAFITSTYYNVMTDYMFGADNWSDNVIQSANHWFAKESFDSYRQIFDIYGSQNGRGWDGGMSTYHIKWNCFAEIRQCNLIIEKVGVSDFPEQTKNRMIAEAKTLRAIINFYQARAFGKLMIVDKVLTPDDDFMLPRTSTIKDTYDFIIKDLEESYLNLPESAEKGRLTKGAALALLSEIALHGAAYIESGNNEYYQKVIKYSELLFNLNYELDNDYKMLFNSYNYARGSREIILAQWSSADNTIALKTPMQLRTPNCNNDILPETAPKLNDWYYGWSITWPSLSLANSYLVVDVDGIAKKWDETSYYSTYTANGGYVSSALFKNRDLRFDASLVRDSTFYFHSWAIIRDDRMGNLHWDSNIAWPLGGYFTKTGFYFRKGMYENLGSYGWETTTPYHRIALRLGRSYLNFAEALLRTNNVSRAVEYINKTRTTHGGLPALSTGISSDEAWYYYKIERRVELFDEFDRYWSLLRWGKAEKLSSIPELVEEPMALNISGDGKSFEIIPLVVRYNENSGKIFTEKRYLLPVPMNEILLNKSLDQNPGW